MKFEEALNEDFYAYYENYYDVDRRHLKGNLSKFKSNPKKTKHRNDPKISEVATVRKTKKFYRHRKFPRR